MKLSAEILYEFAFKVTLDIAAWAMGTIMLAKALGWDFSRSASLTLAVVFLKICMSPWK